MGSQVISYWTFGRDHWRSSLQTNRKDSDYEIHQKKALVKIRVNPDLLAYACKSSTWKMKVEDDGLEVIS